MTWGCHRKSKTGGPAPATLGFNAVAPEWLNGAADAAPAIPAAESTLGSHPCVALSSAQVFPEWMTSTSLCNTFSTDGDYPFNFVSHPKGSLQRARPCPTFGRPVHLRFPSSITARHFSSSPSDSTSQWTPCPPENNKKRLQIHLGCLQLSFSCPFRLLHTFSFLWPARNCPRVWIWCSSFEHQRDFNPPEQHAAQHTVLSLPT